jgi:P27 family predicted phage terminase small subunit
MTKGPRPKPTAAKKRAGNPGKRKLNTQEARIPSAVPTCPSHLIAEARREWKRMSVELYNAGLLTKIDRAAFAGYCQAWARWVKAEKKITEKGEVVYGVNGTLKASPWMAIAKNAKEEMRKFLIEFGMTPSSRSKVKASDMEQMSLADLLFEKANEKK